MPYKNVILFFLISLIVACDQSASSDENKKQPNIIFILADDLGNNEVGFNRGDDNLTPHIDQLREGGMSLTRFYVHAVCTPTRAAFITGRYPFRTWSDWRPEDFGKPSYLQKLDMSLVKNEEGDETRRIHALPTEERTIAEAIGEQGYFTALIGKWGCGEWLEEHLPMAQGFDYQYGHYAWGIDYTNFTIPHNSPARFAVYDWHRNQHPVFEEGYSTDLIANEVVELISQQKEKHANSPFFYYVPFNAPHGPLEEIPRYTDTYEKRFAAIKCMDDGVGRIIDALEKYELRDNTLVVFTNDNGAIRDSMNVPYRGTKNTNFDGGVRVPCVLNWPGKLKEGSTNNELMHITDFYSTLVTLAGGSLEQEFKLDGIDMNEVLFNNAKSPREEIIFEVEGCVRFPAMLSGDFKLIGDELFNLKDDPTEKNDIAATHAIIVDSLKRRVTSFGMERPPLPDMTRLMTPALPWVYGQQENENAPEWLKEYMKPIRDAQPQSWAEGTTPWPQAPKDGKIIYTGDGR